MALSNSQYNAVMRVYSRRQVLNRQRQEERLREVYERIPQVEALTDEITAVMAQAGRRMLEGDPKEAGRLKKDAALLREQRGLYLKRGGYTEEDLEMQYHCPKCKDTGYTDGRKCSCFKQM